MKKKILTLGLVLSLAATAIVGGTLAYFTDDEKATNVMTAGNVDINLEEFMVTEEGKVKFESDKTETLYPMTDEQGVAMNANKVVEVFNTSSSKDDVYIRVLIAFESMQDGQEDDPLLHFAGVHSNDYVFSGIYGMDYQFYDEVEIGGDVYDVYVFNTIDGLAVPYEAKVQPMSRVWLDKTATNEDMKALGEDGKMNILVLAQGVQTANFDNAAAAFAATYELSDENIASWFAGEEAAADAVINDWVE